MFKEHGSFEQLEIRSKRRHIENQSRTKSGGWFTKSQLEGQHQWTKTHGFKTIFLNRVSNSLFSDPPLFYKQKVF